MITIISGSGREDNRSKKIAAEYHRLLSEKQVEAAFLALDEINVYNRDAAFVEMEKNVLIPAQKFIIILPEYNGSYPGILKLMIDHSDVKPCWANKKVLLTGISSGRAGNLRGMEHLTGSLLYMKSIVHPNRLPISSVNKLLDEQNKIKDYSTLQSIDEQLNEFLQF